MYGLPDVPGQPHILEMRLPLPGFAAEGARHGGLAVLQMFDGLPEKWPQARAPAWSTCVQSQGLEPQLREVPQMNPRIGKFRGEAIAPGKAPFQQRWAS